MSEAITLTTGETETIYGTLAGALAYLGFAIGEQYTAFRGLADPNDQKRCLATARRYIDRFVWNATTAGDFATRDAIVDASGRSLFQLAQYELAALAASDPSKLSTLETGSNVRSAGAGSARVEFFARTSVAAGTASPLPDVAMQLIGSYLGSSTAVDQTYGQSGNAESSFEDSGEFELIWPK